MRRRSVSARIASIMKITALGVRYLLRPNRFTLRYPEEYPVLAEGYRGFIVLDFNKCIGCGSCARICPTSSMKMVKVSAKTLRPVINYQRCIFCGFCVDVCPVQALRHVRVHDIGYYDMNSMKPSLGDFQKEVSTPAVSEGARPIKFEFDPDRGLVKTVVKRG